MLLCTATVFFKLCDFIESSNPFLFISSHHPFFQFVPNSGIWGLSLLIFSRAWARVNHSARKFYFRGRSACGRIWAAIRTSKVLLRIWVVSGLALQRSGVYPFAALCRIGVRGTNVPSAGRSFFQEFALAAERVFFVGKIRLWVSTMPHASFFAQKGRAGCTNEHFQNPG